MWLLEISSTGPVWFNLTQSSPKWSRWRSNGRYIHVWKVNIHIWLSNLYGSAPVWQCILKNFTLPNVLDLETNSVHLSRHTCPISIKLCKQSSLTKGIQVYKCIYVHWLIECYFMFYRTLMFNKMFVCIIF